jgi:BirA family biotin operon repressor/biotin-[acetyl-CoA-carboxylase] ligase
MPTTSFIELQSVDSTNNYARRLLTEENMPNLPVGKTDNQPSTLHGTSIFAHQQLAGKGQRSKEWISEKNANIILSILLKPDLLLTNQFQLSACVALAVHDFFNKYAGDDTRIKWPNDLYWQDRKAGGILIENVFGAGNEETIQKQPAGLWKWAIVGIGININQTVFHPSLPNPVSLKQITGKEHDPIMLAKELAALVLNNFQLLHTDGFSKIYATYLTHLYKINKIVKLKKGSQLFEAIIKGVSPTGALIAQHSFVEEFNFDEIQWVI